MQDAIELHAPATSGPSLNWPGKSLSVTVTPPALHIIESTLPQTEQATANLLLHGDNRDSLAWLLANGYGGTTRLIYLDPPYDSGVNWTSRIRLRGSGRTIGRRTQYGDQWPPGAYLQFMAERLLLLKELLHADGTIWLHCDHRRQGHLLLLMEEIFGADAFLNTISWRSQVARGAKVHARYFPNSAQYIHIFQRTSQSKPVWHPPRREIELTRIEAAAQYMEDEGGFFRTSHPGTYSFEALVRLHKEGRIYAPFGGDVIVDEAAQRVYGSKGGNIGIKYYVAQRGPDQFVVTRAVDNLWDDIPGLGTIPSEDVNYPTQKTTGLLQRILETGSDPGDLVLDPFVGSGTTVAVAERLGRSWIGCDANWGAVRTASDRLADRLGTPTPWQIGRVRRSGLDSSDSKRVGVESNISDLIIEAMLTVGDGSGDGERGGGGWILEIRQVHAPELIRLAEAAGETADDWRALVASVAIDPDFNPDSYGEGSQPAASPSLPFRPGILDAPQGRKETVAGRYVLDQIGDSVGVRITTIDGREGLLRLSPVKDGKE